MSKVPEDQLQNARPFLAGLLRPRAQSPEIEHARQLTHQYKKMVEQRFRETRKPGTISALVGRGRVFPKEGRVSGNHSFHYWDDKALVHQTLRIFEGQELEIMERVSRSQGGATLVYEQELSSGGLMKRHEERFPLRDTSEPKAQPCNAEALSANADITELLDEPSKH